MMEFHHVDVFSKTPLRGNGLTVVFCKDQLAEPLMLSIAQEFKQYETAFVFQEEGGATRYVFSPFKRNFNLPDTLSLGPPASSIN